MRAQTYSTNEVARMIGATYRQLDYWARMGRIPGQPAGTAHGSGTHRRWSTDDVREARRLLIASWLKSASIDDILRVLDDLGATKRLGHEIADRESAPLALTVGEAS